jgi:hypothetical protein
LACFTSSELEKLAPSEMDKISAAYHAKISAKICTKQVRPQKFRWSIGQISRSGKYAQTIQSIPDWTTFPQPEVKIERLDFQAIRLKAKLATD